MNIIPVICRVKYISCLANTPTTHFFGVSVKNTTVLLLGFVLGCGSGGMPGEADDARRFAMAESNRLATTEREVHKTEGGQWRAQRVVRNAIIPAWPDDRTIKIVYQQKTIFSDEFATQKEAEEAEWHASEEGWTERTLWYVFEDGKWSSQDK